MRPDRSDPVRPGVPDLPAGQRAAGDGQHGNGDGQRAAGDGQRPSGGGQRWRVPAVAPVLKLVGAGLLVLLAAALAAGDPVPLAVAALTSAGLLGWALRDLIAPVRLAADEAGLTVVTGYAGHRRLDWARIERITVDTRARLGLRTGTLEIDVGDTLHLFGRYDLGAPPEEVAEALRAARPPGRS